ncbi:MAG: secretin N-terminal domain-containing protein [Chthoniobacterales bacterium]
MSDLLNPSVFRTVRNAALLLACASFAHAQVQPDPLSVASSSAAAAPAPAAGFPTSAAAAPVSGTPAPTSEMVTLQFPNSDVADVLRFYEQLTNKKLVMDNFVQGKVNIFVAKPLPREEAINIIKINLLMNGYSLVPAEGDVVKVIGTGKNPRTAGVPIISDESMIPAGEQVISFLFKLHFADPTELQQVLGQYLSPPQPYTSFLALPKSSSILVTENSSVIRSLVNIISQVDIPPAEVVSEFIRLERADATKVVDMLKDVFEKNQQGQPGAPQPGAGAVRGVRPGVPVPPQAPIVNDNGDIGGLAGLSEDSVIVGKIKISPDVRTNRIHVITRPINMPFVKKLIAEFDANVEFAKPVTRPLRYISAADVLPVIVQALQEPGGNGQGGGQDLGAGGGANQNHQQQDQQHRLQQNSAGTSSDFGNTSSGAGGGQTFSEELSTQAVDTTPKAVTIGNSKIIADQRANTIIILGNREVVVKVQKVLDEMDVKAPQVALSTVIGELTIGSDEEFGVDWFARYNKRFAVINRNTNAPLPPSAASGSPAPIGGTGGIFDPANLLKFTQLANLAAGGANVYLAAGNSLLNVVHMLDSTGRFRTISRPTVFTSNNKKAIIASGQEIPVPVSTLSTNNGGGVVAGGIAQQSNIQFKKVALQLEVVPLINSEKEVSLDILQKIDSLTGESTNVDGNSIPTISTRYIKTSVAAPNCSTIVLGGLIMDNNRKNKEGIPVLSRIPLLGGLFRNTSTTKSRQELLVLMRPEVSLTEADLRRLRMKNSDKTHFGPEIDQDDCPDCPPRVGNDKQLPPGLTPPDLPEATYNPK